MAMPDDCPLDAVLNARNSPPDDEFRRVVLTQTLGVLRRRRRLKRCALGACLLGCYLAGIVTVVIGWPGGIGESRGWRTRTTASAPGPSGTPPDPRSAPAALGLRQLAGAELSDYERWRRAGDECLRESGDISRAVRDYTRALDLASGDERAISPVKDNWLLMALKNAHAKERQDAHPQQN